MGVLVMDMVSHGQRIQYTMCDRKMRYRDRYAADVQIAVLQDEDRDRLARGAKSRQSERLAAYTCPYCDGIHIGHQREGKKVYR